MLFDSGSDALGILRNHQVSLNRILCGVKGDLRFTVVKGNGHGVWGLVLECHCSFYSSAKSESRFDLNPLNGFFLSIAKKLSYSLGVRNVK